MADTSASENFQISHRQAEHLVLALHVFGVEALKEGTGNPDCGRHASGVYTLFADDAIHWQSENEHGVLSVPNVVAPDLGNALLCALRNTHAVDKASDDFPQV